MKIFFMRVKKKQRNYEGKKYIYLMEEEGRQILHDNLIFSKHSKTGEKKYLQTVFLVYLMFGGFFVCCSVRCVSVFFSVYSLLGEFVCFSHDCFR